MRRESSTSVFDEISRSGYYPQIVTDGLRDALAGEEVRAHIVHHEPTFDRDQIRRHMTVLVLTPSRVVLLHTDEHPADDVVPRAYTSTTSEAVAIGRVRSVVVSRMVSADSQVLEEAVLTIGWGSVSHIDVEPARCSDPDCEADHGYSGSLTSDDFTLRLSAAADGAAGPEQLLEFGRMLSVETAALDRTGS